MPTTAFTPSDPQRAAALLEASARLLEVGESGIALAGLERADALQSRVPQIKRARAIALAQMERPLDAARALMEELALSPDDGEAFRTFLGMMDRVPEIRALPEGSFFRLLLRRMDEAVERRFAGHGHGSTLQRAAQYAALVLGHGPAFETTYAGLGDDASRTWMLELATLVALGDERVRLPFDEEGTEEFRRLAEAQLLRQRDVSGGAVATSGGPVDLYDLTPVGLPLRLLTSSGFLAGWAHLGQLELAREGAHVGPRPGDVVVEGGGCLGDGALWLAHRVGPSGRVFSFEVRPEYAETFRRNLELNPGLAGRVELVAEALHARSGGSVAVASAGASGATTAPTRAVDDFVRIRGLPRVDFLRLDLDGAERDALAGAEQTLRRDRPRLAISIHHRPEDLGVVPAHVLGLGLGYRVFLGHFTPGAWQTVLYAIAD